MFMKTITYLDYDNVKRTEDFYFHLDKADLIEMKLSTRGDFSEYLKEIIASKDGEAIISNFKKIIAKSVGVRSENGRRFIKNDEIRDDFMQTPAYSEFLMELTTNAGFAAEFVKNLVPEDMRGELVGDALQGDREYTHQELLEMSDEEFARVAGDEPKNMSKAHLMVAYARRSNRLPA